MADGFGKFDEEKIRQIQMEKMKKMFEKRKEELKSQSIVLTSMNSFLQNQEAIPTIVLVWSETCSHCLMFINEWEALLEKIKEWNQIQRDSKHLRAVSINASDPANKEFIESEKIPGFPYLFYIDFFKKTHKYEGFRSHLMIFRQLKNLLF